MTFSFLRDFNCTSRIWRDLNTDINQHGLSAFLHLQKQPQLFALHSKSKNDAHSRSAVPRMNTTPYYMIQRIKTVVSMSPILKIMAGIGKCDIAKQHLLLAAADNPSPSGGS